MNMNNKNNKSQNDEVSNNIFNINNGTQENNSTF